MNPYAYLQQVAGELDHLTERHRIEPVLDELEYLFEVLDPELQDPASRLIESLRSRVERLP